MDQNKQTAVKLQIERTMKALEANRMQPFYAETSADAVKIVESLLQEGETISCGGSVTLKECGVRDLMLSGKYHFLNREREGITPEEIREIYLDTFRADTFLTSANAITEKGELFNVDGNSNRVAAIVFGPKSVIVVAGYNKIVPDLDAAILRLKKMAAPANAIRLNTGTYCALKGECASCAQGEGGVFAAGCRSDKRICCNYVVSSMQRVQNRIKVILVGEELGY